jgi:hypothetical protein
MIITVQAARRACGSTGAVDFSPSHFGSRKRIADHVGGGTAHIKELTDADQQQSALGEVELIPS